VAAVQLQAAVDDAEAGIGREPLGHGRKPRRRWLAAVERGCRTVQHQSRRLDLGRVIGNAEGGRLGIGKARAELLSLLHVSDGAVEAELCAAKRAGGNVETAAVEPAHCDLETLALGADAVRNRHPALLEDDHRGWLRMPAELLLLGAEREARGT